MGGSSHSRNSRRLSSAKVGSGDDEGPCNDAERRGLVDRWLQQWSAGRSCLPIVGHDVRNAGGEVPEWLNGAVSKTEATPFPSSAASGVAAPQAETPQRVCLVGRFVCARIGSSPLRCHRHENGGQTGDASRSEFAASSAILQVAPRQVRRRERRRLLGTSHSRSRARACAVLLQEPLRATVPA